MRITDAVKMAGGAEGVGRLQQPTSQRSDSQAAKGAGDNVNAVEEGKERYQRRTCKAPQKGKVTKY